MALTFEDYAKKIALLDPFEPINIRLNPNEKQDVVTTLLEKLQPITKRLDFLPTDNYANLRMLLRATLNILEPKYLDTQSIILLDSLLQTELVETGIVDSNGLTKAAKMNIQGTKIIIWQGDITTLKIDAIVNAANDRLLGCFQPLHGCIDNAIHSKAGVQLRDDCHTIMQIQKSPEPTGAAKVTRGYNLPSRFVIHTVGPHVIGKLTPMHEQELKNSYTSCLEICSQLTEIRNIAFCCISTGVFGYPYKDAAYTALNSITRWLKENPNILDSVVLNVFTDLDKQAYRTLMTSN